MLSEISQLQKEKIFYDSTYIRYLKQSNLQKQKIEWWLPGPREWGKWEVVQGYNVSVIEAEQILKVPIFNNSAKINLKIVNRAYLIFSVSITPSPHKRQRDTRTLFEVMDMFICLLLLLWRRKWHPTPVFLPGKLHGWRNLVGYSPWGCKELYTTERLHFHFYCSDGILGVCICPNSSIVYIKYMYLKMQIH